METRLEEGFDGGFGDSNCQPQQNNSLFGEGGGIFGNKPISNQTVGSIFGQKTSPNTGGSLFGSNNQPNTLTLMFFFFGNTAGNSLGGIGLTTQRTSLFGQQTNSHFFFSSNGV